jgi:hypothetical protein
MRVTFDQAIDATFHPGGGGESVETESLTHGDEADAGPA